MTSFYLVFNSNCLSVGDWWLFKFQRNWRTPWRCVGQRRAPAPAELDAPSSQLLGLERREERKLAKDINTGDVTCNRGHLGQATGQGLRDQSEQSVGVSLQTQFPLTFEKVAFKILESLMQNAKHQSSPPQFTSITPHWAALVLVSLQKSRKEWWASRSCSSKITIPTLYCMYRRVTESGALYSSEFVIIWITYLSICFGLQGLADVAT